MACKQENNMMNNGLQTENNMMNNEQVSNMMNNGLQTGKQYDELWLENRKTI